MEKSLNITYFVVEASLVVTGLVNQIKILFVVSMFPSIVNPSLSMLIIIEILPLFLFLG